MDSSKLNDWMQVFGIFALVASLVFVGFQIRQDRSIALVESMATRADTVSGLADMIGNNPALWIRGLDDDELSEEEKVTFHAMCEAVESQFVSMFRRYRDIGGGPPSNSPTGRYAFALYTHSGLRRAWNSQITYAQARDSALGMDGSGRQFREEVNSHLARFDKNAPPLPTEKRHIFR